MNTTKEYLSVSDMPFELKVKLLPAFFAGAFIGSLIGFLVFAWYLAYSFDDHLFNHCIVKTETAVSCDFSKRAVH